VPKVLDKVRHGFDVYIYTRDEHPPAHCHVWQGDQEAVVELDPVRIRGSDGLHSRDLRKIVALIEEHREELLAVWDSIFPRR
jgi:hypothetical protein